MGIIKIIINTKGKGLPTYLMTFVAMEIVANEAISSMFSLCGYKKIDETSNNSFNALLDVDDSNIVENKDTLISINFTIVDDMFLSLDDSYVEEYFNTLIGEKLVSFLAGCDFELIGSTIIKKDKDVSIKQKI